MRHDGSHGIYGFVEGKLFGEARKPDEGLVAYLRAGDADEDVNQIGTYIGGGLVYTGLFPGRNGDTAGTAFCVGINGNPYKEARASTAESVTDAGIVVESTYRAEGKSASHYPCPVRSNCDRGPTEIVDQPRPAGSGLQFDS